MAAGREGTATANFLLTSTGLNRTETIPSLGDLSPQVQNVAVKDTGSTDEEVLISSSS
jgi:hypothetical protein